MIDLSPLHLATVKSILAEHVPECEVRAYGSRATWTARDYSDVDLAVVGKGPQDPGVIADLKEAFQNSDLPMRVDVLDWHGVSEEFREAIKAEMVVLPVCEGGGRTWSTLANLAKITMGQSPPGKTVNRERTGTPLLNGPSEFGPHHPEPVQYTTDVRRLAHADDILFCVRGATTGRMNWADRKYAIGRGIAAIRHREDPSLQPFIRAVIEFGLAELLALATGSTFPNVSKQQLGSVQCPSFDESEQRAIAHILGTLDDKIELNRRMNETLEAMARALFKSWFVDFDPVRAKLEGRDTGLPEHLADLFPDRLVDSEMGEMPEGWSVFRLDQLARHHTKSVSPYRSPDLEYEHFSIPAFDAGQRPAVDPGGSIRSNKTVVQEDAVLLSKLNPRIARVWVPAAASGRPQICSTEFLVFTPRPPANRSLLFALFADRRFRDLLKSLVTGTSKSHQRVPPKALKAHEVMAGSAEAFAAFGETMGAVLSQVLKNRSETSTLADLRDTLLPKLISGEIRVLTTDRGPAL